MNEKFVDRLPEPIQGPTKPSMMPSDMYPLQKLPVEDSAKHCIKCEDRGPFCKMLQWYLRPMCEPVRSVAQTQAWMTAFETIHQSDNRACAATIRQFLVEVVYICILSAEHEKMRTNNTRCCYLLG